MDVPRGFDPDLYAIPALIGATILVVAQENGSASPVFPALGAGVCVVVRLAALQRGVNIPIAPSERRSEE